MKLIVAFHQDSY